MDNYNNVYYNLPLFLRIKYLRANKGLKKNDIAKKSGITKQYLSMLELNDRSNPSLSILIRLSKAYDITVSQLLQGIEEVTS